MKRGFVVAVTLLIALLAGSVTAQDAFQPFLAHDDLFTEGERNTLQRDADLAQRSGVPIMFVVIQGDGTSAGSAQQFAEEFRRDHAIETEPGADDGIVFLVHWVPAHPEQSTVVYSAGGRAYDTTGLSDETISTYINEHVQPLLDAGRLFDANVFLIRFTRYTSLYVPPPVREITGINAIFQQVMTYTAPLIGLAATGMMWRQTAPSDRLRWGVISVTLAGALALFILSVWTHSRLGIASLLVMLISLAVWCLWITRDQGRRATRWRHWLPDAAILLVLVGISLSINMQQVDVTPADRDETRWINRAYYAADLSDPFGPTWQDYITTVGQPPLGSVAIGIGMSLQGQDLRATGVWDYQYGEDWFRSASGYPSDDAFRAGRTTSAVIGAFTTGAAFVLGTLISNRAGGIAAGAFVAWHPLHIVLSSQALSDETFVLLLLLALIAAWQFAAKPTWPRAIAFGVLLGLGGATKLTPLLLAPPLVVYGVARLWFDRTETGRRAGWMLIAQPFIAFAAFVVAYPWLWPNPLERTWRLFSFRTSEMEAQTSAWPDTLTETPLAALASFGNKLTHTHSTTQKLMQHIYDWAGIDRTAVGIDMVLATAGAVILLWTITRTGLWTPHALVGCLLLGELVILAIGMRADFYRYHLPVVMIASACIAVSAGALWNFMLPAAQRQLEIPEQQLSAEVVTQ